MISARDQAIEVIARAMYEKIVPPDPWWEGEESQVHDLWRERAVVVLDALLAATQETGEPLVLLGPEHVGWLRTWPDDTRSLLDYHRDETCEPVYRRAGSPDDE